MRGQTNNLLYSRHETLQGLEDSVAEEILPTDIATSRHQRTTANAVRFQTQVGPDTGPSLMISEHNYSVSPSLYSAKHQLASIGRQIHENTVSPKKASMHFGSPQKYSGINETPRVAGLTTQSFFSSRNATSRQEGQEPVSPHKSNSIFSKT